MNMNMYLYDVREMVAFLNGITMSNEVDEMYFVVDGDYIYLSDVNERTVRECWEKRGENMKITVRYYGEKEEDWFRVEFENGKCYIEKMW